MGEKGSEPVSELGKMEILLSEERQRVNDWKIAFLLLKMSRTARVNDVEELMLSEAAFRLEQLLIDRERPKPASPATYLDVAEWLEGKNSPLVKLGEGNPLLAERIREKFGREDVPF